MSKKGVAPPKLAPGVAIPKEIEDEIIQWFIDIENFKIGKPKSGKQNQAAPDTGSNHSFSPQESDGDASSDNDFQCWQNRAAPETAYSNVFTSPDQSKSTSDGVVMSKKGIPPPKLAPAVAIPKEIEGEIIQLLMDIENFKIGKPKSGKQNQAAPDTGSNHSFSPQESDGDASSDNDFQCWQNRAAPETAYSNVFTSPDQSKSTSDGGWVPSALEAGSLDLPPEEVWEDYEHLLYEENQDVHASDEWEDYKLKMLTDIGYEDVDRLMEGLMVGPMGDEERENDLSRAGGYADVDGLMEGLMVGPMGDEERENDLSSAGCAHACTPPSSSTAGDTLSTQIDLNDDRVVQFNDVKATDNQGNLTASAIEGKGDVHIWQYLHPAPPPLVMTEEERLEMQGDGGLEIIGVVPVPDDVDFEDDAISEFGSSVAQDDDTVVLGDSAEVIALRAEVERVRAEIALLRRNFT